MIIYCKMYSYNRNSVIKYIRTQEVTICKFKTPVHAKQRHLGEIHFSVIQEITVIKTYLLRHDPKAQVLLALHFGFLFQIQCLTQTSFYKICYIFTFGCSLKIILVFIILPNFLDWKLKEKWLNDYDFPNQWAIRTGRAKLNAVKF